MYFLCFTTTKIELSTADVEVKQQLKKYLKIVLYCFGTYEEYLHVINNFIVILIEKFHE